MVFPCGDYTDRRLGLGNWGLWDSSKWRALGGQSPLILREIMYGLKPVPFDQIQRPLARRTPLDLQQEWMPTVIFSRHERKISPDSGE